MRGVGSPPGTWLRLALDLESWMSAQKFSGYDPHDWLASPTVGRLTLGSRWLAVAWTQLGKRSPVQLRPLLRVPRSQSATTMGLVLAARLRLGRVLGWDRFATGAGALTAWLHEHAQRRWGGAGWGYPFPWANRDFFAPAATPSAVVTALVAHALLDAADERSVPGARALGEEGAMFIRDGLQRVRTDAAGAFCFSYTPLDQRAVHNANLLAASILARVAACRGDEGMAEDALQAARWSARAQRVDGSWPYGVGSRNGWVDSFHTSYNLIALHDIGRSLGREEFVAALQRGVAYWRRAFLGGPAVGFYPFRYYPVDAHAVAHAIITLLTLRGLCPDAVAEAERLARWALAYLHGPTSPPFYYQRHRWTTNRLVYMRWTQAWMLLALAELAAVGRDARALGAESTS